MTDPPIILHHFDASPFSEKVRLAFGLKTIAWSSVLISRIMPRPDLMPMTGGYRRTPTMQIGADIYCDTQCILREIERRCPAPSLYPDGASGLGPMTAMWSDKAFFQTTVNVVFGSLGDKVPDDFIKDRSALRGAPFDVAAMTRAVPQMRDAFRAHVDWIDMQLGATGAYLVGREPSLVDINAYMNVWYVLSNLPALGAAMLAEFPATRAWATRIAAIGHGERTEMSSADALALATHATPQTAECPDPNDPNGRKPGDRVSVAPDDYGKLGVEGEIVALSPQHIAIRRHDAIAGDIVVHFPRAGFTVT